MTDNGHGPASAGSRTITLGSRTITVEPPSGRKAARAFALLRAIGNDAPNLIEAWGAFETEYERTHYVELDRVHAEFRYGPSPLVVEGEVIRYEDGHPKAGEVVMVPGPVSHMTEEAWLSQDNKLRLPKAPGTELKVAAMLRHEAIEAAEDNVYRLLALFAMTNADVKAYRREGTLKEKLDELVDELLDDAALDELIELAVVAGEVIDEQFRRKAQELGERLGNALRVLGVDPTVLRPQTPAEHPQTSPTDGPATSSDTPSIERPTSSTDSGASTGGTSTPSSISPGTSSPPLETAPSGSG